VGSFVQLDMVEYADTGVCYGLDDATLLLGFDASTGKCNYYHFMTEQKQFYSCLRQQSQRQRPAHRSNSEDTIDSENNNNNEEL
jgi:hypothetical protein